MFLNYLILSPLLVAYICVHGTRVESSEQPIDAEMLVVGKKCVLKEDEFDGMRKGV